LADEISDVICDTQAGLRKNRHSTGYGSRAQSVKRRY
jgi:hypothetical protein